MRLIALLLVIMFANDCFANDCFANDTIKVNKQILLDKIGWEYAPQYLLIEKRDFLIGYNRNNGFFNNLFYSKDKYSQVYFRNSTFNVTETLDKVPSQTYQSGFYVVDSCIIKHLPIANSQGDIIIANSNLGVLTVQNTNNLKLNLGNDSSISFIMLDSNRNLNLQVVNCSFKDSAEMRIFNTTVSQFSFGYHKRSGCNILFQSDTINWFNGFMVSDDEKELAGYRDWYKHENIFTFYNCYINGDFTFFEQIPNSTIIFNKCTFGPNVYLGDMAIDRLIIRNCFDIPEQLSIGFREKDKEVEIGLTNSNLDQIRFDFTSNMRLIFDSSHTRDVITNSYKSLLEKFNHEGKDRSYRFVDLQYRKYNQVGFWHFLNCIWWYHGYMPGLVFVWTIGLLFAFFLFNLRYWTQIHEAYPIVDGQKAESFNRKNQRGRFYSTVLLYTILIFFSLRVNFDRLKFKRLDFVYILLGQYIIGLWCLLFIIRFVFKL